MTDAELASRMTGALSRAAEGAKLVSIEITRIAEAAVARIETRVERKTRTLAFLAAEAFDAAGARVATANSVHRVVA